jgi:hypothetical protein
VQCDGLSTHLETPAASLEEFIATELNVSPNSTDSAGSLKVEAAGKHEGMRPLSRTRHIQDDIGISVREIRWEL